MTMTVAEHLARMRAEDEKIERTRYAIQLVPSKLYAGQHRKWTDSIPHALTFVSMTTALGFAINELELDLDQFTVEAV